MKPRCWAVEFADGKLYPFTCEEHARSWMTPRGKGVRLYREVITARGKVTAKVLPVKGKKRGGK